MLDNNLYPNTIIYILIVSNYIILLIYYHLIDKIQTYAIKMLMKTDELQNEKRETERLLYQV